MASSTSTASGDEPRGPSSGAGAPLQALAEWAASLQAYYAAGGHPYAWPAAQGVPYPAGEAAPEAEGNRKMKSSGGPYGDGSSGSDGGSEESSDKRDASADQKVSPSAKRRKSSNANVEGGPSQPATTQDAAAESPFATKRRSASQLSVSTLERAALSNPTTNLNIGMDIWSNSPTKAETLGQGEMNAGAPSQHAGALSQMQDKRDLKRERRKKSNRESARKSRLRKQQECEELAQKVTDLTEINGALRSELDQLKKACEGMEAENSQLMDEMEQSEAPGVLTTLSMQIDTSKVHANNGQRHKKNNNDSKW
ncbi:DNA-binding protein EMBP-1-like isoform X6 [Phragmites australis]|uniref:DNA-binding protein EMBP-1-like isoform X6 n=1 Tax=Phragmites australis TaxID=29695 RepID=UPI002D799C3A|nr:DNA-binding protein EMBP-1-like isoform X6 [Phragmites australis]